MAPGEVFDVLCVGFGPASLAIAVAIAEHNTTPAGQRSLLADKRFSSLGGLQEALGHGSTAQTGSGQGSDVLGGRKIKAGFIEKYSRFKWHPGMMVDGAKMQISFLKDLATVRNPTSSYTFLSYLHSHSPSRLLSFISLSTFAPSRKEYAAYMAWAADKVRADLAKDGGSVNYGEQVVDVTAVTDGTSDVELLRVVTKDVETGEIFERLAKNVIVSTGGAPRLPHELSQPGFDSAVFHSSRYLDQADAIVSKCVERCRSCGSRPVRIAIVGGGQSSAEIFLSLRKKINSALEHAAITPQARPRLDLLIRRGALRPSDDSPFSNEVFDPGMSQAVYNVDSRGRAKVMKEARNTNYSVVNPVTLEAVYETMYDQKVDMDIAARDGVESDPKDPLMTIHPYTTISHADKVDDAIRLSLSNSTTFEARAVEYDFVIAATGYYRQGWREMLFPSSSSESASLTSLFDEPTATASMPIDLSQMTPTLSTVAQRERKRSMLSDSDSVTPSSSRSTTSVDSLDEHGGSGTTSPSSFGEVEDPMHNHHASETEKGKDGRKKAKMSETLEVEENYRLRLPATCTVGGKAVAFKPTIWIQGGNEDTHGLSDSLLSVLAVRSGEVVSGLLTQGNF